MLMTWSLIKLLQCVLLSPDDCRLMSVLFLPPIWQCVSNLNLCGGDFVSKLLDRKWALPAPDAKIHQIVFSSNEVAEPGKALSDVSFSNNTNPSFMMSKNDQEPSFFVVRDDLLHPLINGNKARKLDALIPLVEDHSVTDVVRF